VLQRPNRPQYLDTMIVEISDDNISAWRCHGTKVWTSQVPRVARTTRSKFVDDPSVWLENVHSTAAIVDDNDSAICITADTLRTKQFASANSKQHTIQVMTTLLSDTGCFLTPCKFCDFQLNCTHVNAYSTGTKTNTNTYTLSHKKEPTYFCL